MKKWKTTLVHLYNELEDYEFLFVLKNMLDGDQDG